MKYLVFVIILISIISVSIGIFGFSTGSIVFILVLTGVAAILIKTTRAKKRHQKYLYKYK